MSTLWRPEREYDTLSNAWSRVLSEQDRKLLGATVWAKRAWFGLGTRPALLVIDMYGAAAGPRGAALFDAVQTHPSACGPVAWQAVSMIAEMLATARLLQLPVIHATGLPGGYSPWNPKKRSSNRKRVVQPAGAWDFIPECAPIEGEIVLQKGTPSAFSSSPLRTVLRDLGCDTVVVVGEATSGCVRGSVVDGRCDGFAMAVVEDGTFDRFESSHDQSLFDLDQKYADVITCAETTSYLQGV